jgi:hypothetical protein
MKRPLLPAVLALVPMIALGGCASASTTKVAACDGRHRRAVNIHGSVLGEVPAIAAGQPSKPGAPRASTATTGRPAAKPTRVSVADGTSWSPSC